MDSPLNQTLLVKGHSIYNQHLSQKSTKKCKKAFLGYSNQVTVSTTRHKTDIMAATVSETSHASIYQKMLIRLIGFHTGRNHPQAQGSEDSSVLLLTLIKQIKEF